jgi:hypothetical protein
MRFSLVPILSRKSVLVYSRRSFCAFTASRAEFHVRGVHGVDQTAHPEWAPGAHRRLHQSIHGLQ